MRFISRFAEFVGFMMISGNRVNEYRCPRKYCGFSVSEDYNYCPYCGQKLKFKEPPTDIKMKRLW